MFMWGLREPSDIDIMVPTDRSIKSSACVFNSNHKLMVDIFTANNYSFDLDFHAIQENRFGVEHYGEIITVASLRCILDLKVLANREKDQKDIQILREAISSTVGCQNDFTGRVTEWQT